MASDLKVNALTKILLRISAVFLLSFSSLAVAGATSADDADIQILALGDSLTAGYGLPAGEGFTDQLEVWLNERTEQSVRVVNGGVSGDTSTGGRSRMDWALAPINGGRPDLVILELGANDALRGVSPDITRENIEAMVKTLTERNIPVLIAGMLASPSWGPDYEASFNSIYPDMSEKYDVPLYPFFLDGVATIEKLNQDDGLHPTAEGVAIIVGKIGPMIQDIVLP